MPREWNSVGQMIRTCNQICRWVGWIGGVLGLSLALGWSIPIAGQDLRMESQVYNESQTTPLATTLTLFQNKMVYDFAFGPDGITPTEIVIYDSRANNFELLDVKAQRRLHLEQFELVRMLENMRQQGTQDPRLVPLILPQLQEQVDLAQRKIVLENSVIRYEAWGTTPGDITRLPLYQDFLDQYSRLAATDPRRLPPFARLELNQALKKYGWMAQEIRMRLEGGELYDGTVDLTSKHQWGTKLSEQDLKRIELAKKYWMQFRQVPLSEYRDIPKTASNAETTVK